MTIRKRFKAKKRNKKGIGIKLFLFIILGFILYFLFFYMNQFFLKKFVSDLLNQKNIGLLYQKKAEDYVEDGLSFLSHFNTKNPLSVLENTFHYEKVIQKEKTPKFLYHKREEISVPVRRPSVYIYSTHQTENYQTNTVFDASKLLKEKLLEKEIDVTLEERIMGDYLKANGLDYGYSYQASRFYLKDTLQKRNDYDLIIDFHRDALSKYLSTTTIDGKNYAKMMFVIGKASSNYNKIKENSEKMNTLVQHKYPSVTRGIFEREGAIYNQDVHPNMILIEVGGQENTYSEVENSVGILTEIITEYLKGES